jgi:hypothetical protein
MQTLCSRISSDIRVSQTPKCVFLYATSAHAAVQAEQAVRDVLAEHDVTASVRCDQWNPIQQSWTSHEDLMKAERDKSAAAGRATWQVRVASLSHHELKVLARRLEAGGLSVALRWTYLIAGASREDDAHALADQIQGYSSVGPRIRIQPGVYDRPPVRVWASPHDYIWVLKRNRWSQGARLASSQADSETGLSGPILALRGCEPMINNAQRGSSFM